MKIKIIAMLALLFSLSILEADAGDQTNTGVPSHKNNPQIAAADHSEELEEAKRLGTRVVQLYGQGKYSEAVPLAKRVLEVRERLLSPSDPLVEVALINLSELHIAEKKFSAALPLYKRVLKIKESKSAVDDPRLVPTLTQLAFLNYMAVNLDESEKLYLRSLNIREKALGVDHLDVAQSAFNLAEYYRFTQKYAKAEPLYERAVLIRGRALGAKNDTFEKALERYQCLYYEQQQSDKADELNKRIKGLFSQSSSLTPTLNILNGKAISLPKPSFPEEARGLSGTAVIKVVIDESGRVVQAAETCGGYAPFVQAAEAAARKARFTPTTVDGQPVKVTGMINYNFKSR